jgi:L-asparaginase II
MDNIAVEVTRGALVESAHRGSVVVTDDDGRGVFAYGDAGMRVFPRSAVKSIQALPLVESGAAEAYGFGDAELALACSSHSGEPDHVATARGMLAKAGLDESALECGAHWSNRPEVAREQARTIAAPGPAHNNCSGKHSGFLALARRKGWNPRGYVEASHPVQKEIRAALEDLLGEGLDETTCGTDGCSIPTYAVPLDRLATAFARMGTGRGLSPERAAAARRLFAAGWASPFHVAGTGRFCTEAMRLLSRRLFIKTGAEGVFCASLPDEGLGIALKCEDGATRASEAMVAAVIARFLPLSDEERAAMARWANPEIRNWRGIRTGEVRLASGFAAALSASHQPATLRA